jgi:hypothetical protein
MRPFFLLGVAALGLGWGTAGAAPATILGKCPQAPSELRMASQGALYSCQKVGCDGQALQEPMATPTPPPVVAQILCDAGYRLTARIEGKFFALEEFGTKDRCLRAVEQFKTFKGCYCTPEYAPKCFLQSGKGPRFEDMTAAFARQDACLQALDQLSQPIEVKPR